MTLLRAAAARKRGYGTIAQAILAIQSRTIDCPTGSEAHTDEPPHRNVEEFAKTRQYCHLLLRRRRDTHRTCWFGCVAMEFGLVRSAQHRLHVFSGLKLAVKERGSAEAAPKIVVQQQLHNEKRIVIVAWRHGIFEQLVEREGMNGETRLQPVGNKSLHRDECEGRGKNIRSNLST